MGGSRTNKSKFSFQGDIMKITRLILILLMLSMCLSASKTNNLKTNLNKSKFELIEYKYNLSKLQSEIIISSVSNLIYEQHKNTTSLEDIREIVTTAYQCSFIFNDLGKNHVDRFTRILGWAETESGFNKYTISKWKKGQKITIGNKVYVIRKSSTDYGVWQVNEQHLKMLSSLSLMKNKIPLSFNEIKSMNDLMDIKTNCVARCIIETDRKSYGMDYKHDNATLFLNKLSNHIRKLETEQVYYEKFVEKFNNSVYFKKYTKRQVKSS